MSQGWDTKGASGRGRSQSGPQQAWPPLDTFPVSWHRCLSLNHLKAGHRRTLQSWLRCNCVHFLWAFSVH